MDNRCEKIDEYDKTWEQTQFNEVMNDDVKDKDLSNIACMLISLTAVSILIIVGAVTIIYYLIKLL